jgi:predicted MFS family arabinose efflux permease
MHFTGLKKPDIHEEVNEVFIHNFIKSLGLSLVSIFIPMYLMDSAGFTILQVGFFFLTYYIADLMVTIPCYHLSSRIGYKKVALLSAPFLVGYYFLLQSFSEPTLLYMATAVGATGKSLYWAGMNPETAMSTHEDRRDSEVGIFYSMPTLASIITPVIGGLIVAGFSYNLLFIVTALLVGASFVPLFFGEEHSEGLETDLMSFFSWKFFEDFLTYFFNGAESIGKKLLWPLFLVLIIDGSVDLGVAGGLKSLGAAITSIAIGRITDDDNRPKVIASGVLISVLMFSALYTVTDPLNATLLSLVFGLGRTPITMSAFEKALENAEKEDYLEYFAFRGTALNLGGLSMIGVIVGSYYLTQNLITSVIVMNASIILFGYFLTKISER